MHDYMYLVLIAIFGLAIGLYRFCDVRKVNVERKRQRDFADTLANPGRKL